MTKATRRPGAKKPKPARTALTELFGDEVVIYCERTRRMHCLDVPASLVWSLCDGERDVPSIVSEVAEITKLTEAQVLPDVERALATFEDLGLLR